MRPEPDHNNTLYFIAKEIFAFIICFTSWYTKQNTVADLQFW